MLIARPSPVTLYSTVCIALALGGGPDPVLLGSDAVADGEGGVGAVDVGFDELGIAGSGDTAVCFPPVPFAITSAMTNAATSSTATAAAIHNQRGAFGRPGGRSSVAWYGGGWPCSQYWGILSVGWVAFALGVGPG